MWRMIDNDVFYINCYALILLNETILMNLSTIILIAGSYVYIETSSPRQYGDNAKLELSVSNSEIGKLSCLRFFYHMYGETINTLNVYNGITKIFSKSGNQGNLWLNAKLTMTLQTTVRCIYVLFLFFSFRLIYGCGCDCVFRCGCDCVCVCGSCRGCA